MIVRNVRRRRGAGMTEYIILVGMIAIGLVGAIKNYQYILDITVRGSGDKVQKDGADSINNGGGGPVKPGDTPDPTKTAIDESGVTKIDATHGTYGGKPVVLGSDGKWHYQ